ncbi:MAG: hypothetical protein AAF639_41670, partial [Chloroflexota bacterium]
MYQQKLYRQKFILCLSILFSTIVLTMVVTTQSAWAQTTNLIVQEHVSNQLLLTGTREEMRTTVAQLQERLRLVNPALSL